MQIKPYTNTISSNYKICFRNRFFDFNENVVYVVFKILLRLRLPQIYDIFTSSDTFTHLMKIIVWYVITSHYAKTLLKISTEYIYSMGICSCFCHSPYPYRNRFVPVHLLFMIIRWYLIRISSYSLIHL